MSKKNTCIMHLSSLTIFAQQLLRHHKVKSYSTLRGYNLFYNSKSRNIIMKNEKKVNWARDYSSAQHILRDFSSGAT